VGAAVATIFNHAADALERDLVGYRCKIIDVGSRLHGDHVAVMRRRNRVRDAPECLMDAHR